MALTRLIYTSKVSENVDSDEIEKIIQTAQTNNNKLDITGALFFNQKYFLQILEGGQREVNQIYNKILGDSRHHDVMILEYSQVPNRLFSKWDMRLFLETKINRALSLKYSTSGDFDPYDLSAGSAVGFLSELSEGL